METSTFRTRTTSKLNPTRTSKTQLSMHTHEDREEMIREEAYYLAEQDGFRGDPVEYWLTAERRVDSRY